MKFRFVFCNIDIIISYVIHKTARCMNFLRSFRQCYILRDTLTLLVTIARKNVITLQLVARKRWISAHGRGGLKDQEFHISTMHVRCKSWASFGSEGSVEVQDHFFSRRSVQKCFLHWGETITLNGYVHSFREKIVQP